MVIINLAIKLEDIVDEAKEIKSLTMAVHDAMYCSYNSYEGYEEASRVVVRLAGEHSKHLSDLMNEVAATRETEKAGENVSDKKRI